MSSFIPPVVNSLLILGSLLAGYASLSPSRLARASAGPYLCVSLVVILPLSVLGSLLYARTRCDSFRLPSFRRFAIDWSYDPLQTLFLATLLALAFAIGGQIRYSLFGPPGYMSVAERWCGFAGLVIGQLFGYPLFYRCIHRT